MCTHLRFDSGALLCQIARTNRPKALLEVRLRPHRHFFIPIAALLLAVLIGHSQAAAPASVPEDIRLPITEHTLKNGMHFLIVERHDSPTFAAHLRFPKRKASTRCLSSPG